MDGLLDDGALEAVALLPEPVALPPDPDHARTDLSPAQREAAAALKGEIAAGGAAATLLEGVTGSGKTEVYFEAVAEAVRRDRQALILMPEIALTAQFLDRFAARFGVRPAAWHSGVTGRRRERLFAGIASGEVKVVVGARSALFLPYPKLGLIVVDEEHEIAYKQDDGVHYNARDMAVVRGRFEQCPVVLASATPSIETRVNVERGRYRHLSLPERFGGRQLPNIRAVDLKREALPRGRWLSQTLVFAMTDALAAGEQALLFLNRRGYAPLTLCRACAHRYECPNCSAWLVEHRFRRRAGVPPLRPRRAPASSLRRLRHGRALVSCGPGVERIAEEVAELFPEKRCIVLSSDFPGGAERLRAGVRGGRGGRGRHRDRHAAGRQGPQLSRT